MRQSQGRYFSRRRPDRRYNNRQRALRRAHRALNFRKGDPYKLSTQRACRAFVPRIPREYVGEHYAGGRIVTIPQYSGHMLRSEFRLVNIGRPYNQVTRSNPLLLKKRGRIE